MKHFALTCLLAASAAQAATAIDCDPEPQVRLDRMPERVIVVGENHGTQQAPAFVARLACLLLQAGRPVMLALERDIEEQEALDRYLASPGDAADVTALLQQGEWAAERQDGRSSAAMLALLEQLRRWRVAGHPVRIQTLRKPMHFDGPPPDFSVVQQTLDRDMADSLTAALTAHSGHTAVLLAGSFHTAVASKMHDGIIHGPSMGDALAARTPIHVIGLGSGTGGQVWEMRNQEPPGVQPVRAGSFDLSDARIDTRVDLGPITASAPAAVR